MYEIEYEFREQDLIHFNELRIKEDPEIQKKIRTNRIFVPAVMVFIGMFYYIYYQDMKTTAYISLLGLGWAVFSQYAMKVDMRRQLIDNYTEKEKNDIFGKHTLTIEQDCLAEKSPGGKHKTPWKEMLRVDYLEEYVHIFIDLDSAIVIPIETVKKGDLKKFSKQAEDMIDRLSE